MGPSGAAPPLVTEIIATAAIVAGAAGAIAFGAKKWHDGAAQRRAEEQRRYDGLQSSIDRLCEMHQDAEQRRKDDRKDDEKRRQAERKADETRHQADMDRLSGEIGAIGKKVDAMDERITGLGERVTRLEGEFGAFKEIVMRHVLPAAGARPAAAAGAGPAGTPRHGGTPPTAAAGAEPPGGRPPAAAAGAGRPAGAAPPDSVNTPGEAPGDAAPPR